MRRDNQTLAAVVIYMDAKGPAAVHFVDAVGSAAGAVSYTHLTLPTILRV